MLKKKIYRKLSTVLLALLLTTTAAVAESSLPEAVQALVPETARLTETDRDDGLTEFEFRDGDLRYEVLTRDGIPVALITKNTAVKAAKANLLTAETLPDFITGEILHAHAEKDDGKWLWRVIVREGADLVEYDLNAETGEVKEMERYFSADLALPEGSSPNLDLEMDDGVLQWERD